MKKRLYSIAMIIPIVMAFQQVNAPTDSEKRYVCLPCGQSCDHTIHNGEGNCGVCGMELVDEASVKFENIDFEDLCGLIQANPSIVLLDVRTPAEFNDTHETVESFGRLKNAVNINIRELESRIGELEKFKDKSVIVYCSHSHRSPQVAYYLSTHGFKDVKNVAGGVSTFLHHGTTPECLKKFYIPFPARN